MSPLFFPSSLYYYAKISELKSKDINIPKYPKCIITLH